MAFFPDFYIILLDQTWNGLKLGFPFMGALQQGFLGQAGFEPDKVDDVFHWCFSWVESG